MVSLSFILLRKKEPTLQRPYKVKHYKFVGITAALLSGLMVVMYIIPGSGSTLTIQEAIIVGGWTMLGALFYIMSKKHYKEKFGSVKV